MLGMLLMVRIYVKQLPIAAWIFAGLYLLAIAIFILLFYCVHFILSFIAINCTLLYFIDFFVSLIQSAMFTEKLDDKFP